MNYYQRLVRPLLFRFDPEWIHHRTVDVIGRMGSSRLLRSWCRSLYRFEDERLRSTIAGISFPNPIGLAAGFDKNGVALEGLSSIGFGGIELGSVSRFPSPGNPERPRLFRLPLDRSIRIFYGVPNDGAAVVAGRLPQVKLPVPLGVNLVQTNTGKSAPPDDMVEELAESVRPFLEHADYLMLNLKCPNSQGSSALEEPRHLRDLLEALRRYPRLPPIFLKIRAPEPERIDEIIEIAAPHAFVAGFYPAGGRAPAKDMKTPPEVYARTRGSITGTHTFETVNAVVAAWYGRIDPSRFQLISAGGVFSAEDAYQRIRWGASLVQIYTCLVYEGPSAVERIKRGLC